MIRSGIDSLGTKEEVRGIEKKSAFGMWIDRQYGARSYGVGRAEYSGSSMDSDEG